MNIHPVFTGDSVKGNVVFNFSGSPVDDLAPFAHGYHDAGRRLVDFLETQPGYRDFDGYPILFLYRHALELYMKAFVLKGAKLLSIFDDAKVDTTKIFNCHKLTIFLPAFKAVCDALGWTTNFQTDGVECWDQFAKIVQGIDELGANAESFRYPVDTKGKEALPHHTVLNVVVFAKHMDPILNLIAGGVTGLHEEFAATAETKYEIERLLETISEQAGGGYR